MPAKKAPRAAAKKTPAPAKAPAPRAKQASKAPQTTKPPEGQKARAKAAQTRARERAAVEPHAPLQPPKTGRPGEDRAAAIRRAAFNCFAEGGFHATTVDDICKTAGVSKGAFYWYFESKEQVFVQILGVWADEVEAEVKNQFGGAFEDKDASRALLVALGREGRRGRRLLPVWLDALVQSQRNPELRKAMAKFLRRVRGALTHVVSPTFKDFYGDKQIETLAGLLLASFVGSISQEMAEPDRHIYDEHSHTLLITLEHFGQLLAKERASP